MTVPDKIVTHEKEFKDTFDVSLRDYMAFHGFDVIRFDERVVHSDDHPNKSCKMVIVEKWGQRAADLIDELLEMVTPS